MNLIMAKLTILILVILNLVVASIEFLYVFKIIGFGDLAKVTFAISSELYSLLAIIGLAYLLFFYERRLVGGVSKVVFLGAFAAEFFLFLSHATTLGNLLNVIYLRPLPPLLFSIFWFILLRQKNAT